MESDASSDRTRQRPDAVGRLHVFIAGRVQGVGFRYFVESRARSLGVTGTVRNLPDGRVEVVAEGRISRLDRLLLAVQSGPRLAAVRAMEVRWSEPTGSYTRFDIGV